MNRFSISNILLKSISNYYIHVDLDLNIVTANIDYSKASSRIFTPGSNFLEPFTEAFQQHFLSAFQFLKKEKETLRIVTAPIPSQEKKLFITWRLCALCNDENTVIGFEMSGCYLKDPPIENEFKLAQKVRAWNSEFDNSVQPYFAFDLKGNVQFANNGFAQLLGYKTDELTATAITSLCKTSGITSLNNYMAKAIKGTTVHYDCTLLSKKGEEVSVHIINTPSIVDGRFSGVNAFVSKSTAKVGSEKILNKDEKRLKLVLGRLKKILDSSLDMICAVDENGKFTYVSAACKEILKYEPKELIGKYYMDFVSLIDVERSIEATENIKKGTDTTNFENHFYRKDGSVANLVWSSRWDENDKRFYSIARDATEKKLSEENLKESEERYKILFYNHSVPSWIYDFETSEFLEVNDAAIEHYGYSREEFLQMNFKNILSEKEVPRYEAYTKQKEFHKLRHKGIWMHKKKNQEIFYAEISANGIDYMGKKARLVLSIDRTEQTIAEQELRQSNERFVFLSQATFDAIWDWDLRSNKIVWNEGIVKMFELNDPSEATKIGWWYNNLHPDDRERVETKIKYHIDNYIFTWEDEYRMKAGESYKYIYDRGYVIYDEHNKPTRMIGAMQDLTERRAHENMLTNLNNSLEKRAKELAESNAELERFAYVASHDLQEPLRMVTSFLQLLEKRYKEKLDSKAHEYIDYAVDGAERMKRLILDLLEYSRVNSSKVEAEDVDLNEIVNELKLTYKNFLDTTKGVITTVKLPAIKGNKTHILQLFQNIIGNACKYKSDRPPVVDISYEEEKSFYTFAIKDNGIGIDPRFFHKIFIIFQRLHNRDEYSGTGIGLAICKKIIDKHGGRIWVTSTPGEGSTFYFTLPKSK